MTYDGTPPEEEDWGGPDGRGGACCFNLIIIFKSDPDPDCSGFIFVKLGDDRAPGDDVDSDGLSRLAGIG